MISEIINQKNKFGFKKYLFNTSWLFAEQGLRILSGLFVGAGVAKYLGPENFGFFSYVLAFTSIFAGMAKLGLDGIVVRELIKHPEKRDIYLGTSFWLKIFGSILVIGVISIIMSFTDNDATTNIYIYIIASGLIFQSFEVVEFYFQSQVLAKLISICKVIQLFLSSSIKIYLILVEAELIWFVIVTALDAFSLAISYFMAYKIRIHSSFYKYFNLNIAKYLLKDSWPLIFSSILVMVYMRIDQIMIKEMLGEYDVGIYSAAVRLSEAFYFIPTLITASIFPAILNAKTHNETLYKERLQRLYAFMVWFAIFIALPMIFFSDWLILLFFGQAYLEAGQVLVLHMWAAVFVFLGVSFSNYLLAENLTKIALLRTLVGVISNVVLNFFLIPIYGLVGAAIATLIAQFITNVGYDAFDKRLHQQFNMKIKAFLMPWLIFSK